MKKSIIFKLCIGVVLILSGALLVFVSKTHSIVKEDKAISLTEHSRQSVYNVALTAHERIELLRKDLLTLVQAPQRAIQNAFFLSGSLKRSPGNSWKIIWNQNEVGQKIAPDFLSLIQKSVVLDQLPEDESQILRWVDSEKNSLFSVLVKMKTDTNGVDRIAVGFFQPSQLFDLISVYKGTMNESFIVDINGIVLAHPDIRMIGTYMLENPLVAEILRENRSGQTGKYKNEQNEEVVGAYERIANTNLYAVSSFKLKDASTLLSKINSSFLVLGIGLILIALAITIYSSQVLRASLMKIKSVIEDLSEGRSANHTHSLSEDEIGEVAESLRRLEKRILDRESELKNKTTTTIHREKNEAFHHLSTGLVREIRNPLVSILGHVQLAREKFSDSYEVKKHLDAIERDSRKTKDLVEDIAGFTSLEKYNLVSVGIKETLQFAIDRLTRSPQAKLFKLSLQCNSEAKVQANIGLLNKAIENILNTVTVIASADVQDIINIEINSANTFAKVDVSFKSKKINEQDLAKLSDPFYVTSGQLALGIDLTIARGVIEAHDGKFEITNKAQDTFVISIQMPSQEIQNVEPKQSLTEVFKADQTVPEKIRDAGFIEDDNAKLVSSVQPPLIKKETKLKMPVGNIKIKIKKPKLRAET